MGGGGVVVVIGAPALRDTLTVALPDVHVALTDSLVEGVWLAGQEPCRGVIVGVGEAVPAHSATRALRCVLADRRLIAACSAIDEPLARGALDQGFDDYVITPCTARELLAALCWPAADREPESVPIGAYRQALDSLDESLREAARWRELASRDEMTGLHNRRHFDAAVVKAVQSAAELRRAVTVVVFSFDDFKAYNQRHGRASGDVVIREFAALLKRCTRTGDLVARLDGDTFAAALIDGDVPRRPGSQHPSELTTVAERFRAALDSSTYGHLGPGRAGPLVVTGGLATYPWDASSPDELLIAAENAMRSEKRIGAGRFLIAGPA